MSHDLSKAIPIISIVDDNIAVCQSLARFVRSLGHSPCTFVSADDFLKSEQFSTSCIITDLHMPGLSGLDLQDQMIGRGYRIPIIFISGLPYDIARTRAIKAGAIGFLNKPINCDHLADYLDKALNAT